MGLDYWRLGVCNLTLGDCCRAVGGVGIMGIHVSIGPRSWVRASLLLACLSSVSPAGAQSQLDSVSYGPPTSQQLSTEALAFGPVADSNNPFGNITFDERW